MLKSILENMQNRASVRRFLPDPLPQETLTEIMEAARSAPSAGNQQPWHFFIITDQNLKSKLAQAAWNQNFVAQAPVCIVVCAEPERSGAVYGQRGKELYCIQDTAAAVQNILLAATAAGIGSCWVGAFQTEEVTTILELSSQQIPVAMIPLGFAEQELKSKTARRTLEDIITYR